MQKIITRVALGALLASSAIGSGYALEKNGAIEESVLRGLRGAMDAIVLPVQVAKERAEDLYSYNNGVPLTANQTNSLYYLNLLNADTGRTNSSVENINDYLQNLNICQNYWIHIQFKGGRFDSDNLQANPANATAETPLPMEIYGKTLYLVPVYATNNYKITAWECITNFTLSKSIFKGDTTRGTKMRDDTTVATRSILSKYTDDPVLQKCVYMEDSQWNVAKLAAGAEGTCGLSAL